jgi:hypothetical protein
MHIKVFDNLSLGKIGGKGKKDGPAPDAMAGKITKAEKKKTTGKAKIPNQISEDVNGLATGDIAKVMDTAPARPHGPVEELTIDDEDTENAGITLDEVDDTGSIKLGEIKVAEVTVEKAATIKAAPVAAPKAPPAAVAPAAPPEQKAEAKPDEADSLNSLFASSEEEENPLASLINSLPDVTAQELMEDLAEIHRIIKEWKPAHK